MRVFRGSRDLFVQRYDSFPINPEKRQSFLKYDPCEDAGGLSREYVLRIPSVS